MALDTDSTVWTFEEWGNPTRLVSPSLDCSSPETTPIQAECGLSFCAVLTESGDVYVWWPDSDTFDGLRWEAAATRVRPVSGGTIIPCRTKELKMDPIKLSALPDLPDLPDTGLSGEERGRETRLIKIAASYESLIGLTNKGHVLKLNGLGSKDGAGIWYYVSKNVRALVPLLKLWCAAATLLRDRQDQEDPSLPSNHG